jgi:hypothetical protein
MRGGGGVVCASRRRCPAALGTPPQRVGFTSAEEGACEQLAAVVGAYVEELGRRANSYAAHGGCAAVVLCSSLCGFPRGSRPRGVPLGSPAAHGAETGRCFWRSLGGRLEANLDDLGQTLDDIQVSTRRPLAVALSLVVRASCV